MENSLIQVVDEQSSTGAAVAVKPWQPGTLGKFCLVTLKVEGVKAGCRKVSSHRFNVGELAPLENVAEGDGVIYGTKTTIIPDAYKAAALKMCQDRLMTCRMYFRKLEKAEAVLYYSCEHLGSGMMSNHMFAAFVQQVAI